MVSMIGGVIGGGDEDEGADEEAEANDEPKPPEIARETHDEWERENGFWVSRYEATLHIPFTRATVEFGFLNSNPKTIRFDDLPNRETVQTTEVGDVTREEYYKFGEEVSYRTPGGPRHGRGPLQGSLVGELKENPELTTTPANVTYKEIRSTDELIAVIDVIARDIVGSEARVSRWDIESFEDVSLIPRHEFEGTIRDTPEQTIQNNT